MAKKKKLDSRNESPAASRDIGIRKKFHPKDLCNLTPQTPTQHKFFDTFYTNVPLMTVTGPAGTGKTFLGMYAALSLVLDDSNEFDKLVIIRSAVETRKQGFLPGEQDDKDAPYEEPYQQACAEAIPNFKNAYVMLKALGKIEFRTTGFLRGINLKRSIVIVDEMQNADYDELSTIITRVAEYSRIILMGDHKQSDLERFRQQSGFAQLMKVLKNMRGEYVEHIEYGLEDIVRCGLVREFLISEHNIQ